MSRAERRAVLLLLTLALLGHGIRLAATGPGDAPGAIPVLEPAGQAGLEAQRDAVARALRPLEQGDSIDLDRASVAELMRLPRVGPALARAIVADRDRNGPFGGVEGLRRVSGVGPKLVESVRPFAAFSGPATRPGPRAPPALDGRGPGPGALDVNQATAAELQVLPGIGPARAAALVSYRELHGPFASLESLTAVSGIGPGVVERLRGHARVR